MFANAIAQRDTEIIARDLRHAASGRISELDTNAFAHFWRDGINGEREAAEVIELKRLRLLVAFGRASRIGATTKEAISAQATGSALQVSEVVGHDRTPASNAFDSSYSRRIFVRTERIRALPPKKRGGRMPLGVTRSHVDLKWRNIGHFKETAMTQQDTPPRGSFDRLVDEQLELAAVKLPALTSVHPSPVDHEELKLPHANIEDLLLGKAEATPEMLAELSALQEATDLSEEELARQALAHGGADNDPATPE